MKAISVASYNIQYSLGADDRYDLARCIDAVRDADIICLQEVERNYRRTNMADQPLHIEALLPDRYCMFAPALDLDASSVGADGRVRNQRRQFGEMTISRWPILSSRFIYLPKIHTGDAPNAWCGMQENVVSTPDGPLRVVNVHLTDITETNRMTQVWAMIRQLAEAPVEGGAWNGVEHDPEAHEHWQFDEPAPPMPHAAVVMGDFNDTPESAVIDVMRRAGYRDTWSPETARSAGRVTFKTNPAQGTYEDMRIDFVFANDGLDIIDAHIDVECIASDHQPVWATVRFR